MLILISCWSRADSSDMVVNSHSTDLCFLCSVLMWYEPQYPFISFYILMSPSTSDLCLLAQDLPQRNAVLLYVHISKA